MKTKISPVDEYIATRGEEFRLTLNALRDIIRAELPGAEETFSHKAACFKRPQTLVGITASRKYCCLHTMSPALVNKMNVELKGLRVEGANINFVPGEALPVDLIRTIIKARVEENKQIEAKKPKRVSKPAVGKTVRVWRG